MSIQSARDFLTKVTKDESFRKGWEAARAGPSRANSHRAAGFEFTRDEIRAAAGEIQDADLEMITGGVGSCSTSETHQCGGIGGLTARN